MIHHGNSSAIARDVSQHAAVLRRNFLANMHFQCCTLLQGTLGGKFDIFAASGESTCWGAPLQNPFMTNWREGLSCSPFQLFQHRISSACLDNGCVLEGRFRTSAPAEHQKEKEWAPAIHRVSGYLCDLHHSSLN